MYWKIHRNVGEVGDTLFHKEQRTIRHLSIQDTRFHKHQLKLSVPLVLHSALTFAVSFSSVILTGIYC